MGNYKKFKTYKSIESSERKNARKERVVYLSTARKEKGVSYEEEPESFFSGRKTVKY